MRWAFFGTLHGIAKRREVDSLRGASTRIVAWRVEAVYAQVVSRARVEGFVGARVVEVVSV
jgi:hypothetical protein